MKAACSAPLDLSSRMLIATAAQLGNSRQQRGRGPRRDQGRPTPISAISTTISKRMHTANVLHAARNMRAQ